MFPIHALSVQHFDWTTTHVHHYSFTHIESIADIEIQKPPDFWDACYSFQYSMIDLFFKASIHRHR